MSEELAKYDVKPMEMTAEDVRKYIAPKATDKELFMFLGIARSYGLNPFKREVHFIKYGENSANIVVGYEIYLKRAEATGKLDGWKVWVENDKATIEIKRKDWSQPFQWTVNRKEFDKQQSSWKNMPEFMLKKVAIAQGFRLAFPESLGGLPYIPEEISSNNSESLPKTEESQVEPTKETAKTSSKEPITASQEFMGVPQPEQPKEKSKFETVMEGERTRLGDEKFYSVLSEHGFERVEDITKRTHQEVVYKALKETV